MFEYARVESEAAPPAEQAAVDVAVLDMNHGWPNLGHDSFVQVVREAAEALRPILEPGGLRVRVLSYDVRRQAAVPEAPGARFSLYVGTGGPGDIDPRRNDGASPGSQGIREDPRWETPLFELLDAVHAEPAAAFLGVCHSFGVLCRWSGAAEPVLRPSAKGGKSAGIKENVLAPEALRHPWFARFAAELPADHRLTVIDHRLFDLVPRRPLPPSVTVVGHETVGLGGPAGEAVTMLEWARDPEGMPRVFGVNHHPEITDRAGQRVLLEGKHTRGEVSPEWYEDRLGVLTQEHPDDASDRRLRLTSEYTLVGPLRHHLRRLVRQRAAEVGRSSGLEDDRLAVPTAGSRP